VNGRVTMAKALRRFAGLPEEIGQDEAARNIPPREMNAAAG